MGLIWQYLLSIQYNLRYGMVNLFKGKDCRQCNSFSKNNLTYCKKPVVDRFRLFIKLTQTMFSISSIDSINSIYNSSMNLIH